MARIEKFEDCWLVVGEDRKILAGPFRLNAEAYRWLDRYEGDPISPSEKRADYGFRKSAGPK